MAAGISSSDRWTGGVGAEHLAAGDPEQEGVADLAGGAGHRYSDGGIAHFLFISLARRLRMTTDISTVYPERFTTSRAGAARRMQTNRGLAESIVGDWFAGPASDMRDSRVPGADR